MLRYIAGVIVLGVGAYLLDDANSSNKRARKDYYDACNEAEEWVEHVVNHVQKKDTLDNKDEYELPIDWIFLDTLFSPVQRVNYSVTNSRVGKRTDFDKLVLEV